MTGRRARQRHRRRPRSPEGGIAVCNRGRYIVHADFTARDSDKEIFAGLEADGEALFRYRADTGFMAQSYKDRVIQLDHSAQVSPYLRFLAGRDPSLRWNGATVVRLPSFDSVSSPVFE